MQILFGSNFLYIRARSTRQPRIPTISPQMYFIDEVTEGPNRHDTLTSLMPNIPAPELGLCDGQFCQLTTGFNHQVRKFQWEII